MYNSENFVKGKESTPSNNFAIGRYSESTLYMKETLNKIRKLADNCDDLQGF